MSFKGKSQQTIAKSDRNLRGKASGWLRHKGNLNWAWRRHKLIKCFYFKGTKYFMLFHPIFFFSTILPFDLLETRWLLRVFVSRLPLIHLLRKAKPRISTHRLWFGFSDLSNKKQKMNTKIPSSIVKKKKKNGELSA